MVHLYKPRKSSRGLGRTIAVLVRFSPKERALLDSIVTASKETLSHFISEAAMEAVQRRSLPKKK